MQIAAVIAARLRAKAPNGASTRVATPVRVMIFEIGMRSRRRGCAATPGRFCEAMVTTKSGSARLTDRAAS